MPEATLLSRLEATEPLTPQACFVLLWSYFRERGLIQAENHARARSIHPLRIEPLPLDGSFQRSLPGILRELADLKEGELDLALVRWLMALDRLLNDRKSSRFEEESLEGLYGDLYKVRRLNHFLPQLYGSRVTSEADQSNSLATYARFHKAVPLRRIDGVQIECLSASSWGYPYLHRRLASERARFQVLIWPFQIVEYPGFDALEQAPPPQFIHLYGVGDEKDLREQVHEALRKASDLKVTLLLFPELTIPPETEKNIRETLEGHGIDGYPILTLFGCCHQRNAAGTLDLNEAVLLGPDGTELHRHRKVAVYTGYSQDRTTYFGEQLEAGDKVSVLECALGNLTP